MKFNVWRVGQTEHDAEEIDARDALAAAEAWAEHSDWTSAEFSIVGGHPAEVYVRTLNVDFSDRKYDTIRVEVVGRAQPVYIAQPVQTT